MRIPVKCTAALLLVSTARMFSGCSTTERPQYQGRSRATPVIDDYYPSKTNQAAAKPPNDHHHAPPTARAEVTIPDKAADIFRETENHFQQLATAVQSKDARQAHQHDNAIRTLIGHIPQRTTPDTKADVGALVRDISDAARAAHRSAHNDQWTEAAAHVKHGQASLAKLRANFKEIPQ
jgi:hypothetical protein